MTELLRAGYRTDRKPHEFSSSDAYRLAGYPAGWTPRTNWAPRAAALLQPGITVGSGNSIWWTAAGIRALRALRLFASFPFQVRLAVAIAAAEATDSAVIATFPVGRPEEGLVASLIVPVDWEASE